MLGVRPEDSSALEFRLLGSLEVWRGAQQLRLGGQRQRGLLALLLLHVNELVRSDQLVDQLFGTDMRDDGLRSLRVAISRLRRVLADGEDSGVVVTRPGGYLLRVHPDQLDVAVFERLVEEGQQIAAGGDSRAAAIKLREALALWRGPALADLSLLEFVLPEIRRLEELRLVALMERIDADLALGRDAELIAELEALVAANPLQERARGQLMLALYRGGRQADALAVYRQTSKLLRDELGLEPSRALQLLERSMLQQDSKLEPAVRPSRARAMADPMVVCPFKGLAPFERSDAEYFCGRERLVSELVTRLAATTLVGIVGPSGIGKSSLLSAGVLPTLAAGVLPGSADWHQVVVRPGAHPCRELARALGSVELAQMLARLTPGERVVIAADQLEELFTLCEHEHERAAFLDELVIASRDHERRILVVVSLRADFYGRCASYPSFAELLSCNHVLVGPMDRDELARAIERPSSRAGLQVERALVDALVGDVIGEPGGLPLMSTALLELWRGRNGVVLGYESYRATSGVRGAVARLAEAAYSRLSDADRRVARGLMLRLASGEEGSLVRRRVPLAELEQIDGAGRVLAVLTDARLLTVSAGEVEVAHEALLREWPRFRAWIEEDRVGRRVHAHLAANAREWEARGRDRADLYRGARLAAALDWTARHPSELNPVELDFIEAGRAESELEQRRQRSQNRRLRGLLAGVGVLLVLAVATGIVALVKQQSASSDARVALARQLGAEAVSEPRIDLAMLLAREAVNLDRSPQTEGTLLATLLRSPAALGTFTIPIDARPQGVALSPDGRTLAVPDNDGNLRFYDARTHQVQRAPLTDPFDPDPPVYSSDGSLLIYTAQGRTGPPFVAVRDAHALNLLSRLQFDPRAQLLPTSDVLSGSYLIDPDNRTAYYGYWVTDAAGNPGEAYLDRWSLPSRRLVSATAIGAGPLLALRLVAGGTQLVLLTAARAVVLDTRSMRPLHSVAITPPPGVNAMAAISPDGRQATIGTSSGSVWFVDLSMGRARQGLGEHSGAVARVAYSPGGRVVVTTGDDDQVMVWDPRTASRVEVLSGHAGRVHGAAFSANGQTLYTSSLDGVLLEWDLGSDRRFGRPFTTGPGLPNGAVDTPGTPPLAISADSSTFAVRIGAATVGLFSARTLRELSSFEIGRRAGVVTALAWAPSGSELAVAGHSGVVQLWTVAGKPRLLRSLMGLRSLTGLPEAVQAVAFGQRGALLAASDINHTRGTGPPDGHVAVWRTGSGALLAGPTDLGQAGDSVAFARGGKELAVGLDDGPALIVDPSSGRIRRTLHPFGSDKNDPVTSLAFARDGTLATGSWSGIVQLWNTASGRTVAHPVLVAAAPVASISFDPPGRRFSTTGGSDGTAKLWFTDTLQQEGSNLTGEPGTWGDAAFSPNGRNLIVIFDNGKAFQWPATLGVWEQHACAVAGRTLTREEWARFVTGRQYEPVCP